MTDTKYVMVPVEPTDEMIEAMQEANYDHDVLFPKDGIFRSDRIYKAMVAAAPTQPSPAESDREAVDIANKLGTAIYETAQKMGIANGDHTALSFSQLLHLLDCMAGPISSPPVIESDKESVRNAALESAAQAIEREGEGWGEDSKYRPHYSDMAAIVRAMKYQEQL